MISEEVYEVLGKPLPPERIGRPELVDLVNYSLAANRISEKLFAQHEQVFIRVPSGKYLARISKLLNEPIKRNGNQQGYFNRLYVEYLGVQFVAYEAPEGGSFTSKEE